MTYWITTDTHFGHEAMVQYCNRPVDFSERILKNLARVVQKNDILIHLGDINIGNDVYWHEKLMEVLSPCNRWLVRGNHDRKSDTWYYRNGWNYVTERLQATMFGSKIVFTHIPVEDDGLFDINIHGHFHNTDHRKNEPEISKRLTKKHYLVALEYTNYQPLKLETILKDRRKLC